MISAIDVYAAADKVIQSCLPLALSASEYKISVDRITRIVRWDTVEQSRGIVKVRCVRLAYVEAGVVGGLDILKSL